MLQNKAFQVFVAVQVTQNVNLRAWRKNDFIFTAENVPPLQFLFLKKHPKILKLFSFFIFVWTRFFFWTLLPVFLIQIVFAACKLLRVKAFSGKPAKLSDTLLFNGSARMFPVYKSSGREEDFTILNLTEKYPVPPEYSDRTKITVWHLLHFSDVFGTFFPLLNVLWLLHKNRKCQIVSLQAFSFLLYQQALSNYPGLKKIIFCNIDRWSYACTFNEKAETIFMQHGILFKNSDPEYYRHFLWPGVSIAYCYDAEQHEILNEIIAHIEKVEYFKPQIKLAPIEKKPSVKYVLLIGCVALYKEIEEKIIKEYAAQENTVLYVKPHPVFPFHFYKKLNQEYDFILIEDKSCFPDVDLVVSYESTLAYEYKLSGKEVIIHSDW